MILATESAALRMSNGPWPPLRPYSGRSGTRQWLLGRVAWTQLGKCSRLRWSATLSAFAAMVRLGLSPALDGKNDESTT